MEQQNRTVPISFRITAPQTSSPPQIVTLCLARRILARPRCVRKTATFPSGTPGVPSSALLFDLEVSFLPFYSFFPHSLSPLVSNSTRPSLFLSPTLFLSLSLPSSLAHIAQYIPIIFFLFYRLGITTSPRGEDVPRGGGVRLNIDYARFETRVMREADRVSPACAAT